MRVGYFTTSATRQSGATYALVETVRRIRQTGFDPVLIVPATEESRSIFQDLSSRIHFLDLVRMRSTVSLSVHWHWIRSFVRSIRSIEQVLVEEGIQILHVNEITDLIGAIAAKRARVPCVMSIRAGGIRQPIGKILSTLVNRWSDRVVVPSASVHRFLESNCASLGRKLVQIPDFAFDIGPYDPLIPSEIVRKELGVQAGQQVVLLVSKLILDKGHVVFLRAAARMADSHPTAVFVVVGGEVEGHEEEAEAIRTLGRHCLPESRIRLLGARDDLPSVYAAADVVVHCPVYPDPYPTVVLLAMLMNKPVIGSAIGGVTEQIVAGETGFLVPPGDDEALGRTIAHVLDHPDAAVKIGKAGGNWVRSIYSPELQARKLREVYESVLRTR